MRAAVFVAAIAACGPSVSSRRTGPSQFMVEVNGTPRTSQGEVLELLHRRASEVCPRGYDVINQSGATKVFTVNGRVGSRPEAAMLVRCR